MPDKHSLLSAAWVKEQARAAGFDLCGIAEARRLADYEFPLQRWLALGFQANMHYMQQHVEKRMDPTVLMEGAKTVICVARGYNPEHLLDSTPRIARYAYGEDYHDNIKRDLHKLRELLGVEGKVCVDTVPIGEKHWATAAGLGWIGRHTLLVTEQWGSWVNLGELIIREECDHYDNPVSSACMECNQCVQACPNGALHSETVTDDNGQRYEVPLLDAARCTAYQTIENKSDTLPEGLKTAGYAFGCDLCQMACPYNAHAATRPIDRERLAALEKLAGAEEMQFKETTRNSAMARIKYQQWKRNLRSQ